VAAPELALEVEGRTVRLRNPGKVLYPAAGTSKAEVLDYYLRAAPWLLPHLRGRPLTLKRYPEGVDGGHFYEKQSPAHRPDWVRTFPVWSEGRGRPIDFTLCEDAATLAWLVNLADLELHTSLSVVPRLECPTSVVFDLDPGAPAGLLACAALSLELRALLADVGLRAWPKVSGGKGLQVYVPLNRGEQTYEETKPFAHGVALALEEAYPDRVVSRMEKRLRPGKVLVDWSQNDVHKTTVNVYSLRAGPSPTVSFPLAWEEVARAVRRGRVDGLRVSPAEALSRLGSEGDLFLPVLQVRQGLPVRVPLARARAPD
jgi:bifunctional non-homologous end joining protein LigD